MRLTAIALLLFSFSLGSCTSEYEERLEEAIELKERFLIVEESHFISPNEHLETEMKKIEREIQLLAKVSGNEELFMKQLSEF
jgi:glycine cleavage system protein P-like pyridoxal-binding family